MTQTTRDQSPLINRKNRVFPAGTINDFALPPTHDFVVDRAEGVTVLATDGRAYQDHLLGSGPLVLGHAHPVVQDAVKKQIAAGSTYYLPSMPTIQLAELIVEYVGSAEKVRYCSDGSEAVFYAMRIARAVTGRERILKFEGGFHGHSDYAYQSFAPEVAGKFPQAQPDSCGVPASTTASVLVARYNDLESVKTVLSRYQDEVAAIVVEPIQRAIEPLPGFLQGLRELANSYGCLLIFDEVVTGFRVDMGGAQALYGVTPDLTALGKSMSGGLPIAAVVGPSDVMDIAGSTAISNGIYMSGTLNGNPLAAAAGAATISHLSDIAGCEEMTQRGDQLRSGLEATLLRTGIDACVSGPPAFSEVVFGVRQVTSYDDYSRRNREKGVAFGLGLLEKGFLVRPGTKIYVSAVHTEQEIDALIGAASDVLQEIAD